jgi:CheY-specific phosphatase CheX
MNDKKAIDIRTRLGKIIPEIFSSLLSIEVEPTENKPPELSEAKYLVGAIDFSGDATGILSIRVTPAFARKMTAAGHGQESEQIENNEKIQNLLDKITNTAAENLNAVLAAVDFSCELSTPLISTNTDSRIDPADLEI